MNVWMNECWWNISWGGKAVIWECVAVGPSMAFPGDPSGSQHLLLIKEGEPGVSVGWRCIHHQPPPQGQVWVTDMQNTESLLCLLESTGPIQKLPDRLPHHCPSPHCLCVAHLSLQTADSSSWVYAMSSVSWSPSRIQSKVVDMGVGTEGRDSGAQGLLPPLTVWLWETDLTSLSLPFLTCKTALVVVSIWVPWWSSG